VPSSLLAGLGLGLSLIIAIGAQNLFVLRQGIRREHVLGVALICMISDALLIIAGVAGIGLILARAPWAVEVVRWAGAAFLVGYGVLAARRAWRPSAGALRVDSAATGPGRATVFATTLALTWLNPHVYLDTVFLLGSVANTHGDARWWFAAGAVGGSILWFGSLAFGARLLSRPLASPRAWRVFDAVIAVVMIALGLSLVIPH
jgi:L-lysine exporter family protein LysE/ArgO